MAELIAVVDEGIAVVECCVRAITRVDVWFESGVAPGEVDLEREVKEGRVPDWWARETVDNPARMKKLQARRIRSNGKLGHAVKESILRKLRAPSDKRPCPGRRTDRNR